MFPIPSPKKLQSAATAWSGVLQAAGQAAAHVTKALLPEDFVKGVTETLSPPVASIYVPPVDPNQQARVEAAKGSPVGAEAYALHQDNVIDQLGALHEAHPVIPTGVALPSWERKKLQSIAAHCRAGQRLCADVPELHWLYLKFTHNLGLAYQYLGEVEAARDRFTCVVMDNAAEPRDKAFARQGLADLLIGQLPTDPKALNPAVRKSMAEADALLMEVREYGEHLPSIFNSHLEFADRLFALGDTNWTDQVLTTAGKYLEEIDPTLRRKELGYLKQPSKFRVRYQYLSRKAGIVNKHLTHYQTFLAILALFAPLCAIGPDTSASPYASPPSIQLSAGTANSAKRVPETPGQEILLVQGTANSQSNRC